MDYSCNVIHSLSPARVLFTVNP